MDMMTNLFRECLELVSRADIFSGGLYCFGLGPGESNLHGLHTQGNNNFFADPGSSGYFGFTNGEHIPPKVLKTSFVCSGPVHYLQVGDRLARYFEGARLSCNSQMNYFVCAYEAKLNFLN